MKRMLFVAACLPMLLLPALALAQTATPAGNEPAPAVVTPAPADGTQGYSGLVYFEDFENPGSFSLPGEAVRYPQWGEAAVSASQLCDEVPQGDFFDVLPLPLRVGNFYAEMVATAFNETDTSIGFATGDFSAQAYDLLFLMNDYQGVWRTERWFYPQRPGLEQRSSARSETPHWREGEPVRIGLEALDGVYTLYLERDGAMVAVFEDTFTPEGNQLGLAIWGSMAGPRRVCFDSVMVRERR